MGITFPDFFRLLVFQCFRKVKTMPARRQATPKTDASYTTTTANLGFEAKLWLAADSRGEAEPERSGDSQPQAARRANAVRQTAEGNRSKPEGAGLWKVAALHAATRQHEIAQGNALGIGSRKIHQS